MKSYTVIYHIKNEHTGETFPRYIWLQWANNYNSAIYYAVEFAVCCSEDPAGFINAARVELAEYADIFDDKEHTTTQDITQEFREFAREFLNGEQLINET